VPDRVYLSSADGVFAAELTGTGAVRLDGGDPIQVTVGAGDGRAAHCTVEGSERVWRGTAAADGAAIWVSIAGDVFVFHAGRSAPGRPAGADEDALTPPMSATVTRIAIVEGQAVRRGDLLVALEAMKMELAIRAPRDGTVRAVRCREGALVQPGDRLVDLT
jgi:biotin carboxyl carrier protein